MLCNVPKNFLVFSVGVYGFIFNFGPLAQLVEQLTLNIPPLLISRRDIKITVVKT